MNDKQEQESQALIPIEQQTIIFRDHPLIVSLYAYQMDDLASSSVGFAKTST
ncbi:MAG: hypothetical protein M3Z24_10290 [Chloroflexota bacterium]|nr:hypothetical protein [Chloroflexota bacterium]